MNIKSVAKCIYILRQWPRDDAHEFQEHNSTVNLSNLRIADELWRQFESNELIDAYEYIGARHKFGSFDPYLQ